eukprot:scaffold336510_cov39-Prasinocladus_malaysianus.AAC.1
MSPADCNMNENLQLVRQESSAATDSLLVPAGAATRLRRASCCSTPSTSPPRWWGPTGWTLTGWASCWRTGAFWPTMARDASGIRS